jgi:hypothetical protein
MSGARSQAVWVAAAAAGLEVVTGAGLVVAPSLLARLLRPLVSIGKHLGMFVDQVQVRARYAISDQPMSAEEWKKQYVKEG